MKEQFDRENFKITSRDGKKYIFDPIRKKNFVLTPEEWVRQNIIRYLVVEKKYPKNLIGIEQKLPGRKTLFRTDIVIYDRNGNAKMIIECKAENVKITQDVFEQISKYNMQFNVDYLLVTNGKQNYICKVNYEDKTYAFLNSIPFYEELK